jgi:hypothetical protein
MVRSLATVCVMYLVILAFVQVEERIQRHRAELLIADLKPLQVNKSTWADAERIRSKWSAWRMDSGQPEPCSAERCQFGIRLLDGIAKRRFDKFGFAIIPPAVMRPFFWHGAMVMASVTVKNGLVTDIYASLWTYVPKGDGPGPKPSDPPGYVTYDSGEYTLTVFTRFSPGWPSYQYSLLWPAPPPSQLDYVVAKPSGCEGCLGIYTEFAPTASQADIARLDKFNLDCMTRWTPCTVERDIYPAGWLEYEERMRESRTFDEQQEKCAFPLTQKVAASSSIIVVRVTGERLPHAEVAYGPEYPAVFVRALKGQPLWKDGVPFTLFPGQERKGFLSDLAKGSEIILFDPHFVPSSSDISAEQCGAALTTPDFLSQVEDAIAGDRSRQP